MFSKKILKFLNNNGLKFVVLYITTCFGGILLVICPESLWAIFKLFFFVLLNTFEFVLEFIGELLHSSSDCAGEGEEDVSSPDRKRAKGLPEVPDEFPVLNRKEGSTSYPGRKFDFLLKAAAEAAAEIEGTDSNKYRIQPALPFEKSKEALYNQIVQDYIRGLYERVNMEVPDHLVARKFSLKTKAKAMAKLEEYVSRTKCTPLLKDLHDKIRALDD